MGFRGTAPARLWRDLLAGLTLAAIAVPEQMATARLGGLPPQAGFLAFAAATVGFAVFGASRRLSAGADSTIAPIFAGGLALAASAGSPHYAALAALLAVMVGMLVTAAGLCRLGWVADLLSTPVTTGFLAGVAVHIALSQAPAVLGVPEATGDVYRRIAGLVAHAGAIQPLPLVIAAAALAVILAAERIDARIPGALIAMVGASAAVAGLDLTHHGVATLGAVAPAWPELRVPDIDLGRLTQLFGLALVIALVVMVQTAATARAFADPGEEADVDRDYVGLGIGGMLAGLVGAFPVNASPPRTAVVAESGGGSQFAGLAAAAATLLLACFGGRLLGLAPTAALAAVLLFVAARIFHTAVFHDLLRRSRAEFALSVLTAVLIVALPIQTGVAIAIFLSLAHGVFTITRARPIAFERAPGTTVWWPASAAEPGETEPGVLVMGFQAPLSFLNAHDFRAGMGAAIAGAVPSTRLLVLEASSIVEIDYTAAAALIAVIDRARAAEMMFAVARLESVRAQAAFDRFGVTRRLAGGRTFLSVQAAIEALAPGLKASEVSGLAAAKTPGPAPDRPSGGSG